METEEYTIRKFAEEWAEAFKAQDSGRLLDMVTEDVVFLPPGFRRHVHALLSPVQPCRPNHLN